MVAAVPRRSDRADTPTATVAPQAPSFEVGHGGKIEGIYRPQDHRRDWSDSDYARLELAEEKPPPAPPDDLPPRRPRTSPRKAALTLAIIIAAGVALPFAVRWGLRLWSDFRAGPAKASGLIVIDSVPSGARLFINDAAVGTTPYVAPNTFEPGTTVSARIVYPGAEVWMGTFPGGVDTSFTAELQSAEQQAK